MNVSVTMTVCVNVCVCDSECEHDSECECVCLCVCGGEGTCLWTSEQGQADLGLPGAQREGMPYPNFLRQVFQELPENKN